MVKLETARLLLREFAPDDVPALNAVDAHPEVARWLGFTATMEGTQGYLESVMGDAQATPRQYYTLALVARADNQLIGRCGFDLDGPEPTQGMVGYALRRDRWGGGYMTEAVRALVDYGFLELKLHRIGADCDPRNIGSWRVLEKAGMRREGHSIESFRYPNGEWADSYHYAILAREWAKPNE